MSKLPIGNYICCTYISQKTYIHKILLKTHLNHTVQIQCPVKTNKDLSTQFLGEAIWMAKVHMKEHGHPSPPKEHSSEQVPFTSDPGIVRSETDSPKRPLVCPVAELNTMQDDIASGSDTRMTTLEVGRRSFPQRQTHYHPVNQNSTLSCLAKRNGNKSPPKTHEITILSYSQ